jgi:thioredoxin reductase (NADPH)
LPNPAGVSEPFDVAIAGGGPAGLSAAIWLSRYLHSVVLVDSGDPRNWETRGVNGFLGLPGVRPSELRANGRDEARKYDALLIDDTIETVAQRDELFEIGLHCGDRYQARRLLLAIGLKDVWPDIPGLARVYGTTAHICPDCDGYETRGKKTVVLGNGRKAVGMALNLSTWTRDLIICTNGEAPGMTNPEYCEKLDGLNVPILTNRVLQVCTENGQLHCLKLENGMDLDVEKIFIATEQYPADDLGAQLGCTRDAGGHIVVDSHYHTSVRNVFAAGDIVPGSQLAIAAAADGAIAALSIHKSLVPANRKLTPLKA